MIPHGSPVALVGSPCGAVFSTADDASAHQWHCDQCAGILEAIERELDALDTTTVQTH